MLEAVLAYLRNDDFIHAVYEDEFSIEGGELQTTLLKDGQYFRIRGSFFNDGVYQYPCASLFDEEFKGQIWALKVPRDVVLLASEIGEYVAKNPATDKTSESFGGYSYTKATNGSGKVVGWQDAFSARLKLYRKV